MKKRILYITIGILVCLLIGFLSSIATQSSVNDWYTTLNKPSFTPPNELFAPVWTALYIMMGISAGMVWSKGYHHIWVKTALYHFVFQLLFNALWSIVFFGLKNPLLGLVVILVLLTLIMLTIKWFRIISRPAAYLLVPYVLWVGFAAVLNYRIWALNP
ncbi:tryptophan-rich sensory protein [Flagellimonas taeanensis]|jgi:tryptophan-rich sensory protein|uniref:TspO and MBR related proteins n=1 Tax=Flagellimonas taeanensis TaxID=1005926 RepID=A0A1M6PEZ4_9FLAO|nr:MULTISPECIES: TspO/MBR family protein [Allomuricauda]MDC6385063.1 tryptophan-rich sensory protein [Muricauda sp. SK9]MEE1961240.1 TspO/MBR family protein [Allomuricauda taeanensis]RIV48970.1 tryptophan-rich sensory protein [Allomuricauda taeanensis]SFB66704.1 TspO and MBR related proteins [Allomuricauda taeanensis]SHK06470.1 TspO and MBR related proteins [Allomuricauda taeanensis]